jgi:hypothetical protein
MSEQKESFIPLAMASESVADLAVLRLGYSSPSQASDNLST